MVYSIRLHFIQYKLYKGCLESDASMFVSLLPDNILKWNKTQNMAQDVYFVFIPHLRYKNKNLGHFGK
jgi:hypothetical protein